MKKKIKSKAVKDFEKELPKIYKKKIYGTSVSTVPSTNVNGTSASTVPTTHVKRKLTTTKSKLGTTKPVKSVSKKKVSKSKNTTSTTLQYPYGYPWPKGYRRTSWLTRFLEKILWWLR